MLDRPSDFATKNNISSDPGEVARIVAGDCSRWCVRVWPDGPEQCSGLPVVRYSADELHQEFGASFKLVEHISEKHKTPWGSVQHFVYCHCLKPH